jgi:hypothetical protein
MQAGGDDNVTVQFIQYGQRKEQTQLRAVRRRPFLLTTAAVLLIISAIVAGIHFCSESALDLAENQIVEEQ